MYGSESVNLLFGETEPVEVQVFGLDGLPLGSKTNMLRYINLQDIRVSDDLEASYGPLPHVPGAPEGTIEPTPPAIPRGAEATGLGPPSVPCGPTGIGATISPPVVPRCGKGDPE